MTSPLIETEREQLKCCENCKWNASKRSNFCSKWFTYFSDLFDIMRDEKWDNKTDFCSRYEFKEVEE